jgi:hypothetical protein
LTVNVPLIMSNCRIPDGINLVAADIVDLELSGSWIGDEHAILAEKDVTTIYAEDLKVRGNIALSDGFHSFGRVDLYGAKIEGQLYCSGGHFSNPGGTFSNTGHETLRLRLAKIDGEAELDKGFQSDGVIDLGGSQIDGDLLMDGATFAAGGPTGLRARGVTVARVFDWTNVGLTDSTELDLSNSSVGVLMDDAASWPSAAHLLIDGFAYQRISSEHADDAHTRIPWLDRQPMPRKPQPFRQLARVFLDNGQDDEARTSLAAAVAWREGPFHGICAPPR